MTDGPDIIFFQRYAYINFGIANISSHLQYHGYESTVIIDSLEKDAIAKIKLMRPPVVGISVMSTEHVWLTEVTRLLRIALPESIIIVGGVHGILFYEEIISDTPVDLVCHSEGEEVLVNTMKESRKASPEWHSIQGIVHRDQDGTMLVNERAPLVDFNDDIIEDHSIYYSNYPVLAQGGRLLAIATRGCPFRCSFCYNAVIHDTFKGKGKYLRQKSVDLLLNELRLNLKAFPKNEPLRAVGFHDDLFTFKKPWLMELMERYNNEIKIPFVCLSTAGVMDHERAQALSKGGCRAVGLGIETGNSHLRKVVLNKHVSDEKIIQCGNILSEYGIRPCSSNIFCLPGESLNDSFKTIDLNQKAKIKHSVSNLLIVFPKTELADYCIKEGFLKEGYSLKNVPSTHLESGSLDIPDKDKIMNIHWLAYYFIRWPWIFKRFRPIVRWAGVGKILPFVYRISDMIMYREIHALSLREVLIFYFHLVKRRSRLHFHHLKHGKDLKDG